MQVRGAEFPMMDKRLLALVPGALRHVLLTVAWQFAGLVANVCFVWAVSTALATLVEGGQAASGAMRPAHCRGLCRSFTGCAPGAARLV